MYLKRVTYMMVICIMQVSEKMYICIAFLRTGHREAFKKLFQHPQGKYLQQTGVVAMNIAINIRLAQCYGNIRECANSRGFGVHKSTCTCTKHLVPVAVYT
jgi:hypothetical protein